MYIFLFLHLSPIIHMTTIPTTKPVFFTNPIQYPQQFSISHPHNPKPQTRPPNLTHGNQCHPRRRLRSLPLLITTAMTRPLSVGRNHHLSFLWWVDLGLVESVCRSAFMKMARGRESGDDCWEKLGNKKMIKGMDCWATVARPCSFLKNKIHLLSLMQRDFEQL